MGTLSDDLKKFAAKSINKTEQVVQGSLLTVGGRMIKDSPVLDGFFRNSWQSSWGAIDGTTRPENKSGAESTGDLTQTLTVVELGTEMFFTNSMPYADKLEYDGHSQQAPNGVVRINLLDWDQVVAKNIKRYNK